MTISVIVCAHNEEAFIIPGLLSLIGQSRPPDEILVINNASTDRTGEVSALLPEVRVVDEPDKGLVIARERGRRRSRDLTDTGSLGLQRSGLRQSRRRYRSAFVP